jgi:hypothetical protein
MVLVLLATALSLVPPPVSRASAVECVSGRRPALRTERTCRRDCICWGAAALSTFASSAASAYDALPAADPALAELEQKRQERAKSIAKNRAKLQPYLDQILAAKDQSAFADATDGLASYFIGEGGFPEGIEAPKIRDVVNQSYKSLPMTVKWTSKDKKAPAGLALCEETRTNGGVCMSPGALAEDSYNTVLKTMRQYAKSKGGVSAGKGKGALMSDGVSAANSAAF